MKKKNFLKILLILFIIILSSTSKITLSHEFWIDPVNFYIKDNEILKANIIIGENYEGSKIAFSKKDFKNLKRAASSYPLF